MREPADPIRGKRVESADFGAYEINGKRPCLSIRTTTADNLKYVSTGCCKNDEHFPSTGGGEIPVGGLLVYLNWKILHALASKLWNALENIIVRYFKHVL